MKTPLHALPGCGQQPTGGGSAVQVGRDRRAAGAPSRAQGHCCGEQLLLPAPPSCPGRKPGRDCGCGGRSQRASESRGSSASPLCWLRPGRAPSPQRPALCLPSRGSTSAGSLRELINPVPRAGSADPAQAEPLAGWSINTWHFHESMRSPCRTSLAFFFPSSFFSH